MIRFLGLLPMILGIFLVYSAVDKGISTYAFIERADDLTGDVVRFDPVGDTGQVAAVIRYHDTSGGDLQMMGPPVNKRDRSIGAPVRLIAPPGKPDQARLNEVVPLWGKVALTGLGGVLAVLIGIGILTMERRRPGIRPRVPLWVRLAVLAAALAVLGFAWTSYSAKVAEISRFPRVRGVVIADDGGHPKVRFPLADGTLAEAVDPTVSATAYPPGDAVMVTYPGDGRSNARIEHFGTVWAGTATLGLIGGGLLLVFLFLSSLRRTVPVPTKAERRAAVRAAKAARKAAKEPQVTQGPNDDDVTIAPMVAAGTGDKPPTTP